MSKILITGGSGLIGTNAVEYYLSKGYTVLNFDIRPPQNEEHMPYWVEGNINEIEKFLQVAKDFAPDYFLHLAARTDLLETKDLINGYRTNISGVQNTIDVVNAVGSIKRVLFASSRLVCRIDYLPKDYEDYCPPNLYGESKMMGEKIVRAGKVNKEWAIFRPTSIWGPWFDSPYIIFFRTIQKNMYFHPGKFDPNKSFGYVKNSIYQLDKMMSAPVDMIQGKTFYLCDYPPLNVKKWAELVRREMNSKKIPTYPVGLLKVAALAGDVLLKLGWRRVPLTSFRLNNLTQNMVYNTSDLEAVCGPLPYNLEEGVVATVQWMKTHKNRDKLAMITA